MSNINEVSIHLVDKRVSHEVHAFLIRAVTEMESDLGSFVIPSVNSQCKVAIFGSGGVPVWSYWFTELLASLQACEIIGEILLTAASFNCNIGGVYLVPLEEPKEVPGCGPSECIVVTYRKGEPVPDEWREIAAAIEPFSKEFARLAAKILSENAFADAVAVDRVPVCPFCHAGFSLNSKSLWEKESLANHIFDSHLQSVV